MREPALKYWQQATADLVRAINGTEIDLEGLTDPAATAIHDLQRERAAIRALVEKWEDDLIDILKYAEHGEARADELQRCIDQLAALCPAPPEDRP